MNYIKNTIPELKAICRQLNIKGVTKKKKDELINMINAFENTPCLVPKIEKKPNITVIPPVKIEMTLNSTLTSVEYELCEKLYNKNDLNTLYNNPNGIKYLTIRSLSKDDLVEISKEKDKKKQNSQKNKL